MIIHGGGNLVTKWMARQGLRPKFSKGLRVTDSESLEIVVAVLTGLINKNLVASLLSIGGKALGISGVDGGMLVSEKRNDILGFVGDVKKTNPEVIESALKSGYIPVIASVGYEQINSTENKYSLLNLNADIAAGHIAATLKASDLYFLTDVPGVLDSNKRLIPKLTKRQVAGLIKSRVVDGGMIPKLEACLTASKNNVNTNIIDGRKQHILIDAFYNKGFGTTII